VPLRLSWWVIVPARPGTIGRLGWVRSIACHWVRGGEPAPRLGVGTNDGNSHHSCLTISLRGISRESWEREMLIRS